MPSYVIVTECGREAKVVARLGEHGVAAYCPTQRKRHFTNRRTLTADTPIFPRYVFVHTDQVTRDFAAIRHAPHVVAFLGQNGMPKPISDAWLMQFLLIQTFGGFDYDRDRKPRLRLGQTVKIVAGQFKALHYIGVITSFDGDKVRLDTRRGPMVVPTRSLTSAAA